MRTTQVLSVVCCSAPVPHLTPLQGWSIPGVKDWGQGPDGTV